jgi:hypothetical protein
MTNGVVVCHASFMRVSSSKLISLDPRGGEQVVLSVGRGE